MIPIYRKDEINKFIKKYDTRRQRISEEVRSTVEKILTRVRGKGDEALYEYILQFDGVDLKESGFKVPEWEIEQAVESIPEKILSILKQSIENIQYYHEKEKRNSWLAWKEEGVILGQRITPLERVGIYVPGGRAFYPSSLIMAGVPAKVAGVKEIVVATPPDENGKIHPSLLTVAYLLGIKEIYRISGAQAVAALAFGTSSIPPVDKIVGPGNSFVAEAKRQVFGVVDIDMIAGPSEVLILADETANPDYVAADLLAQAEHDPSASSIAVVFSSRLAEKIQESVEIQKKSLSRKEILHSSLKEWSGILIADDFPSGIELINHIAPEHLGLHVKNPWEVVGKIQNSGAIFIGSFSPETVGDYWAGPNHILPTNRTARFSSPLGTEDFLKKSSLIYYSKDALEKVSESLIAFAKMEGLDGHANAVQKRKS